MIGALAREPDNAIAHEVLGNVLLGRGHAEKALASFQRALRLDPQRVSTLSNMGLCLRDLGRIDEARSCLEQAANLDPLNPMAATNLAALLFDTGSFAEASAKIEAVLRKDPDFAEAHIVRGTRLLQRGDFAQGWIDYEWRHREDGEQPGGRPYPQWDGKPMTNGTLLIRAEQGLGDQIMFASCMADVLSRTSDCIVECDARLKTLFARSFPSARFYVQRKGGVETWRNGGFAPTAMTWMGSLPGYFRRSPADFPERESYLRADIDMIARWREMLAALGPGLKIGISWRGGTATTRTGLRSIPLEHWLPLLQCPGTHFVSLQYGDCSGDIERIRASSGVEIVHWDHVIQDYDETAALVSALDLVISVQTAVVHLAGALGKPVLVLVPKVAEWRYGDSGERMPWYSSVRLFRQHQAGHWTDVIERIGRECKSICERRAPQNR